MEKINILFIHYHYPPIKNSGVYRNYFLSHALLAFSNKAHLITTSNQNIFPKEKLSISDRLIQHVIPTLDYRTFTAWLKGKNHNTEGAQFSEGTKSSLPVKWLIKLQRSFPFNILFAEGAFLYILLGYFKAVKIIKQQNINMVFSSFMPYADHIVAWMLKRRFPGIVWVADFRDLQVEPVYKNTFWPDFQKKVEKFILKKADIVSTVSAGLTSKMSVLHHNVHTITKGVDVKEPKDQFSKLTIHYSGSLFQEFRDPRPLFRAMAQLINEKKIDRDHIELLYAGKDGALMTQWIRESEMDDIFENKGLISRQEALALQEKSHINIVLTSASSEHTGVLTGKLFEYIETGREILCLINGTKDQEIEDMFERYGLGAVIYDQKKVYNYILSKYSEWMETGQVKSYHRKSDIMRDMSWQSQAVKLMHLVKGAFDSKYRLTDFNSLKVHGLKDSKKEL